MLCRLIIGNRGSGKSISAENDLKDVAVGGQWAVVCWDRPGTLAQRMAGKLWAAGLESRTEFERAISRDGKWMSWPYYVPPLSPDPIVRQNETDLAVEELAQAFYAKKGMKASDDKPYTTLWMKLAIRLWGSVRPLPHLTWLEKCFQPGSPEHNFMMKHASDREAVSAFSQAAERKYRNPIQWELETGAAHRIIDIVRSPVLWAHNGSSVNWRALLQAKKQVYFDLSGVPEEAARALTIFGCNAVINECVRHFAETGQPLPTLIVLEEAGALDLVTPRVLQAMQELRKTGIVVWIVSQTILDFRDQDKFEQILSLCDEHYWFRANAGVERIAKDLADPTWNAEKVRYTRERQVHDGYEKVETVSTSTGKSKAPGQKDRKDERESTGYTYLSKHRTVVDSVYDTPALHEADFRKQVASLVPFQRFVRDLGGVRMETVTPEFDIWPLGSSSQKVEEAISKIRSRPHYQSPTSPPSLGPEQSEPSSSKRGGAAARFGGGSATGS